MERFLAPEQSDELWKLVLARPDHRALDFTKEFNWMEEVDAIVRIHTAPVTNFMILKMMGLQWPHLRAQCS